MNENILDCICIPNSIEQQWFLELTTGEQNRVYTISEVIAIIEDRLLEFEHAYAREQELNALYFDEEYYGQL